MGNKYTASQTQSVATSHSCIYSVIQLNNVEVATCSSDKNVDIWNLETGLIDITLTGYSTPVTSLVYMNDGRLATGSLEKTIRIWTYDNHRCDFNLPAHEGPIRCLIQLSDDNLASGSDDKKIKILDLRSMWFSTTLEGHTGSVKCLAELKDKRLVSGSDDKTIKFWDIKFKKLLGTVEIGKAVSSLLSVNAKGLVCVGSYKKIVVIDCNDRQKYIEKFILYGHHKDVNVIINVGNDGKRIVSGGGGSCMIWDLEKKCCEQKIEAHKGGVYGLNFLRDGRLISGGGDGELKIWNINGDITTSAEGSNNVVKKEDQKEENGIVEKGNKVTYADKDDVKHRDLNKIEKFINKNEKNKK